MQVVNQTRNTLLAHRVIMADNFFSRLKGLIGRPGLPPGWCLVIDPCNSVHTIFMRFGIDLLFVDRSGKAVRLVENLPPFRFTPVVRGSRLVIEFPSGTLARTGTLAGDTITITER